MMLRRALSIISAFGLTCSLLPSLSLQSSASIARSPQECQCLLFGIVVFRRIGMLYVWAMCTLLSELAYDARHLPAPYPGLVAGEFARTFDLILRAYPGLVAGEFARTLLLTP
jgi:hypothetical protein